MRLFILQALATSLLLPKWCREMYNKAFPKTSRAVVLTLLPSCLHSWPLWLWLKLHQWDYTAHPLMSFTLPPPVVNTLKRTALSMLIFYQAVLESLICYDNSAWFGNLPVQQKTKLYPIINAALTIIDWRKHTSLQTIFEQTTVKLTINDPTHTLHSEYEMLPTGRRFRLPRCPHRTASKTPIVN